MKCASNQNQKANAKTNTNQQIDTSCNANALLPFFMQTLHQLWQKYAQKLVEMELQNSSLLQNMANVKANALNAKLPLTQLQDHSAMD